jgi:class 3 adenylate cyclase
MFEPFNKPENLDLLPKFYFLRQRARVRQVENRVLQAPSQPSQGRVLPASGDLPIGKGRHFEAAVLFLDICGFSNRDMDSQFHQSLLMSSMTVFFSEIIRIIEDYGGRVEKNTGDGLMAYFRNTTQISDAHRAASCSLTIMLAAERLLNPLLAQYLYEPFSFRIAFDSGLITVAEVGRPTGFRSSVAIGTAANIASKMLAHCSAGEILVGERAMGRLPPRWRSDCVEPHRVDERWKWPDGSAYEFYRLTCRWPSQAYPEGLSR